MSYTAGEASINHLYINIIGNATIISIIFLIGAVFFILSN